MKTLKLKNTKKLVNAQDVLEQNGFKILSSWVDDNLFEKDGKKYKISQPAWDKNFVSVNIEVVK